jgi:hypothetical protein
MDLDLLAVDSLSAGLKPLVCADTSLGLVSGEQPMGTEAIEQSKNQGILALICARKADLLDANF